MATTTLAAMRTAVRELCAQESLSTATAFVDDTELDARTNEALADLRDIIIEVQGQEWASTTVTIAVTSATGTYPLPVDFDELLGVRLEQGSLQADLLPWEYADVASLTNEAAAAVVPRDYRYRIKGTSDIVLLPDPTASMTLYLDYIPAYTELVDQSDQTFAMPYGAWKWAALSAAIELLAKERIDATALVSRLAKKEAIIRRKARRRDKKAHRVKDTRRDGIVTGGRRYPRLYST